MGSLEFFCQSSLHDPKMVPPGSLWSVMCTYIKWPFSFKLRILLEKWHVDALPSIVHGGKSYSPINHEVATCAVRKSFGVQELFCSNLPDSISDSHVFLISGGSLLVY